MVSEHMMRKFDTDALGVTFGYQQFFSSVMAISAGLMAQGAASILPLTQVSGTFHVGGYCGPFDAALLTAFVAMVTIACVWKENFGSNSSEDGVLSSIWNAGTMLRETPVWMVGCACALYEASMYLWVFAWTPLITQPGYPEPPYGLIFTCFMVAAMFGSKAFEIFATSFSTSAILTVAISAAVVSHVMMILASRWSDMNMLLMSFIAFEITVGMYFPAAGTLKSRLVPESCRATVYNIYRIPLNIIVVLALIFKSHPMVTLHLTTSLLAFATGVAYVLHRLLASTKYDVCDNLTALTSRDVEA
jgi:hypothetical protein